MRASVRACPASERVLSFASFAWVLWVGGSVGFWDCDCALGVGMGWGGMGWEARGCALI